MTSNCRSISTWAFPFWVTGWLSTIMCYAISDTHQPLLSILKGDIPFRYFALLSKSHLQPESHFPRSTKVVAAPVVLSVLTFLSQALKLIATACVYIYIYLFSIIFSSSPSCEPGPSSHSSTTSSHKSCRSQITKVTLTYPRDGGAVGKEQGGEDIGEALYLLRERRISQQSRGCLSRQ